jgi:hypothetical protein
MLWNYSRKTYIAEANGRQRENKNKKNSGVWIANKGEYNNEERMP